MHGWIELYFEVWKLFKKKIFLSWYITNIHEFFLSIQILFFESFYFSYIQLSLNKIFKIFKMKTISKVHESQKKKKLIREIFNWNRSSPGKETEKYYGEQLYHSMSERDSRNSSEGIWKLVFVVLSQEQHNHNNNAARRRFFMHNFFILLLLPSHSNASRCFDAL